MTESENLQIICRIRPNSNRSNRRRKIIINQFFLVLYEIDNSLKTIKVIESENLFKFNQLFDEKTSQESIFNELFSNLLEDYFTKKKNTLLFSYGITNSGKTFTIIGEENEKKGILFRLIEQILDIKDKILKKMQMKSMNINSIINLNKDDNKFSLLDIKVFIEACEIYNEDIYDLSVEQRKDNFGIIARPKLQIKELNNKKILIKDLSSFELINQNQAFELIQTLIKNRSQTFTLLNSNSSRSHTIFKITTNFLYKSEQNLLLTDEAQITIVDLAGSERNKRVENFGINSQMTESCSINKSLLVLGKCIKAFANNSKNILKDNSPTFKNMIPYRESKLTKVLYEYFVNENNIRMIVNINLSNLDYEETIRVLNYASLAKEIQPSKSKIHSTSEKKMENLFLFKQNLETEHKYLLEEKERKIKTLESLVRDMTVQMENKKLENIIDKFYEISQKEVNEFIRKEQFELEDLRNQSNIEFYTIDTLEKVENETEMKNQSIFKKYLSCANVKETGINTSPFFIKSLKNYVTTEDEPQRENIENESLESTEEYLKQETEIINDNKEIKEEIKLIEINGYKEENKNLENENIDNAFDKNDIEKKFEDNLPNKQEKEEKFNEEEKFDEFLTKKDVKKGKKPKNKKKQNPINKKIKKEVENKENNDHYNENLDLNNPKKKIKSQKHKKPFMISKEDNSEDEEIVDSPLKNEGVLIDAETSTVYSIKKNLNATPIFKRLRVRPNTKKHYCL